MRHVRWWFGYGLGASVTAWPCGDQMIHVRDCNGDPVGVRGSFDSALSLAGSLLSERGDTAYLWSERGDWVLTYPCVLRRIDTIMGTSPMFEVPIVSLASDQGGLF